MKKVLAVVLAGLGLVACQEKVEQPGMVGTEEEAGGAQGQAMQGETQTVTGTVASMSGDQISIRSEQEGSMDFMIGENVAITENGQQASKDAISEGDQIRATYSGEGGQKQLIRIEVMGAGQQPQQGQEQQQPGTNQ